MTLTIAGKTFSLAHLAMFTRKVDVPLRGIANPKKILVEFRFSSHCYSRGAEGEVIPDGYLIPDGSKHLLRNRIFDHRRYELSKGLARHIDDLISSNGDVRKSRHDNFFSVSDVFEDANGIQTVCSYFVFMSGRKVSEPNQEKRLFSELAEQTEGAISPIRF
eukprot:gene1462-1935_t